VEIKREDKISFVFGLFVIIFGEYLVLRLPHLFLYFYTIILTVLVIRRYVEYSSERCQLFMLDLCYFVNLSCLLQLHVASDSLAWYQANYALALGSLTNAMVVWQNSLVLHNISKLTSLLLHAFAPFTLHLVRWSIIPNNLNLSEQSFTLRESFLLPMMFYLLWQTLYLIIVEVILSDWITANQDLEFALRSLARDADNGMHQLVLGIMRRLGIMGPSETFQPETLKSKIIFISAQFVYTVTTLLPVKILYNSYLLSSLYLTLILGWTVSKGASSYCQDFMERYNLHIKNKAE